MRIVDVGLRRFGWVGLRGHEADGRVVHPRRLRVIVGPNLLLLRTHLQSSIRHEPITLRRSNDEPLPAVSRASTWVGFRVFLHSKRKVLGMTVRRGREVGIPRLSEPSGPPSPPGRVWYRVPLDEGFPLSGLGPFAKYGIAKAGLWPDEIDDRGRDGNRRKGNFLPTPMGHTPGGCNGDHAGSNCLEPTQWPFGCVAEPLDGSSVTTPRASRKSRFLRSPVSRSAVSASLLRSSGTSFRPRIDS